MNMDIDDSTCWVCGKGFVQNDKWCHMTKHHVLPKHLNPKSNITVPICNSCHKKINSHDIKGIFAFAYKLDKTVGDIKHMTASMWHTVASHFNRKNGK